MRVTRGCAFHGARDALKGTMTVSAPLPVLDDYELLPDEVLFQRIEGRLKELGNEICLLAHHYQRPKIVEIAHFVGDSFKLAMLARDQSRAKNIVFCGVRFMAESAAILCRDEQQVIHPDPDAGCPMADMASMPQVELAWKTLTEWIDGAETFSSKIIPITYMNSTADLKAFVGKRGGIVCTSSNAQKTFQWALERGDRIFFFPDQHLGRNTAHAMGMHDTVLWDPHKAYGGLTNVEAQNAEVILWAGHCPVHMKFTLRDVKEMRRRFPGCSIVVHPECEKDVVDAADASGSTEFITKFVADAPDGSTIMVGTEINMVQRLAEKYPKKRIYKLHRSLCPTMYQINPANLAFALEHLDDLPAVQLSSDIKHFAKVALDRMLALP